MRKGQRRWRGIREVEGRDQRESTGQGGKAIRGREIKKKKEDQWVKGRKGEVKWRRDKRLERGSISMQNQKKGGGVG